MIRIWENGDEKIKTAVIKNFCGFNDWDGIYIRSPKMRDKFKCILLDSLDDDDILNSEIITMLLINESSNFINKEEVWDKIYNIDQYTLLALMENLKDNYNISYIFNNDEDVENFEKILENENAKIRDLVLDILGEIQLKSALKILDEQRYVPKYYNATDIVITLIKETSIKEYEELYARTKDVLLKGYFDKLDIILASLCDYIIDITSEDKLIKDLESKIDDIDMGNRNNALKIRVICDKLEVMNKVFRKENQKIISDFVSKYKKHLKY